MRFATFRGVLFKIDRVPSVLLSLVSFVAIVSFFRFANVLIGTSSSLSLSRGDSRFAFFTLLLGVFVWTSSVTTGARARNEDKGTSSSLSLSLSNKTRQHDTHEIVPLEILSLFVVLPRHSSTTKPPRDCSAFLPLSIHATIPSRIYLSIMRGRVEETLMLQQDRTTFPKSNRASDGTKSREL